MKSIKRQTIPYILTCGFHTIEVRVDGYYASHPIFEDAKVTKTFYKTARDGDTRTYIILNLNKLFEIGIPEINELLEIDPDIPPHKAYIEKFSVFCKALSFVLDSLGIAKYKIVRADLKFDNSDPDFFETYEKLQRYILLGFKAAYGILNQYKVTDLDNPTNISASVRQPQFQIESYDKRRESASRDPSASRFEIRSIGRSSGMDIGQGELEGLKHEFLVSWHTRFKKAVKALEDTEALTVKLIEWLHTKTLNKNFSATLLRCEDYLYSTEQAQAIATEFNYQVKNFANFMAVWKKRYNIKLYSIRDVKKAIAEIYRSMDEFFMS